MDTRHGHKENILPTLIGLQGYKFCARHGQTLNNSVYWVKHLYNKGNVTGLHTPLLLTTKGIAVDTPPSRQSLCVICQSLRIICKVLTRLSNIRFYAPVSQFSEKRL